MRLPKCLTIQRNKMKNYIIFLGAALILGSCSKENKETKVEEVVKADAAELSVLTLTDEQLKNIEIETATFENQNLPSTIRLNAKAELAPQNTISITNPYGGYVKQISLIPGNYVQKGQVVVVLEDPLYIQMQEDYLTTKTLLVQANADYIRQRDLNAEQAASDKVLQQAKATQQSLQIKKRALEDKLRLMNINPATVSVNTIHRTINVYSPISGVVSDVYTNIGEYVSPANAMLQIINPNNSLLNIKVFEKDLSDVQVGQNLQAFTNANPNQKLDAQVSSISNQVNPDGTIDVFAKITNLNGIRLTANMYFNIELTVNQSRSNAIPEEAVVEFEGKKYLFEQGGKNKFILVEVKTGTTSKGVVEIISPSNTGKTYVTKGAFHLLTAMKNSGEDED